MPGLSIHLPGKILLVDEILAVGDLDFQLKCYDRIAQATRGGRTVLFVSHATEVVCDLCENALVLEGGRLAYQGSSSDAAQFYLKEILGRLTAEPDALPGRCGTPSSDSRSPASLANEVP